ncbi:MAG: hypothetical protein BroJett013_25620 [Alphaproteobacteria bacterium]|nr:MAG: hypothetical protein BroJett013_25620 [Alphaproteobacteria bacterium]
MLYDLDGSAPAGFRGTPQRGRGAATHTAVAIERGEDETMGYYYSKIISRPFDAVQAETREALGQEGFGIITEIDVRKTLKSKIEQDFRDYVILGACNPRLAFEALQLEDKVGTMLPCNVIVQDAGAGRTEVAAIDPAASMQAIPNEILKRKAEEVGAKLRAALDRLQGERSG